MEIDITEVYKLTRSACGKYTKQQYKDEFDDLVQEVMMYVLRSLHRFDPAKGKLSTFIYGNSYKGVINYRIMRDANKRWWEHLATSLDEIKGDEPLSFYQTEDSQVEGDFIVSDIYSKLTPDEKVLFEQLIGWIPNKEVVARTSITTTEKVYRKRQKLISKIKDVYFDLL